MDDHVFKNKYLISPHIGNNTQSPILPILFILGITCVVMVFGIFVSTINLIATHTKASDRSNCKEADGAKPCNVEVTDLTSNSFTLSWQTRNDTKAFVEVGNKSYSDGSQNFRTDSHVIKIDKLIPYSFYTFSIKSNGKIYKDDAYGMGTLDILPPGVTPPDQLADYKRLYVDTNKVNKPLEVETSTYLQGKKITGRTPGLASPGEYKKPILIVLDSSLTYLVENENSSLSKWISRQAKQGHDTELWLYKGGAPNEVGYAGGDNNYDLRSEIKNFYEQHNDTYFVWLIGNIPPSLLIKTPGVDKIDKKIVRTDIYPSDILYMNLKATCVGTEKVENIEVCNNINYPPSGTPSLTQKNSSEIEIPLARLPIPPIELGDQRELLENFFKKAENFTQYNRGLIFSHEYDDSFNPIYNLTKVEVDYINVIQPIFESKLKDNNIKVIKAFDYSPQPDAGIQELRNAISTNQNSNNQYDIAFISTHGSGNGYHIAYPPDSDNKKWSDYWVDQYLEDKGDINFIYSQACLNGVYTKPSITVKQLYLGKDTVGSLASTQVTIALNPGVPQRFFDSLFNGNDMATALRQFYKRDDICRNWSLLASGIALFQSDLSCGTSYVYIGDPTIKFDYNPTTSTSVAGPTPTIIQTLTPTKNPLPTPTVR